MELKNIVAILKEKDALLSIKHYQNGVWQEHSAFFDSIPITKLESPENAEESSISFLEKEQYLPQIQSSKARAILVRQTHLNAIPHSAFALICENPYLAMAYLTEYFATPLFSATTPPKIHESAKISPTATIGNGSEIGKNCIILANVNIGENVKIGDNCVLFPGVSIMAHRLAIMLESTQIALLEAMALAMRTPKMDATLKFIIMESLY